MVRRMALVVMCVGVACVVATRADAALSAGQKMAAEALIKQFSSPEFETRQQAVDNLVALGKDVVPLVRKALAETPDNEVKLRCQMVLKALGASAEDAKTDESTVDGLKITLLMKVETALLYVDKDDKLIRVKPGEEPPEGAVQKEFKSQYFSVQLKNVGNKPIVLGVTASGGHVFGALPMPFKLYARNAQGKELPRIAMPAGEGVTMPTVDPNEGTKFTLLKPGQEITETVPRWTSDLRNAKDKITVWAEFEQEKTQLLPNVTTWGGKLKSNEVEYDMQSWFFNAQDTVKVK